MKLSRNFVAAVSAVALFAGCAKKEDAAAATPPKAEAAAPAPAPVAVIDGASISKDVWELWVKTRSQGRTTAEALTPEQRKEFLDDLVRMYVAAKAARDQGLDKGVVAARAELMANSSLAEVIGKNFIEGKTPLRSALLEIEAGKIELTEGEKAAEE